MKIELKKFDYIVIGVVAVLALLFAGIMLTHSKIAKTPVVSESTVVFQVFFRGITLSSPTSPLKPLDESFITIRNVPHKKITILSERHTPRMTVVPNANGGGTMVQDVSAPLMFDSLVTLFDDAKVTDDGVVMGGNKLKIGLPIVLEGKNYRFSGTVSDINILTEEEANNLKKSVAEEKERLANPQPISPMEILPMLSPEAPKK